MASLKLIKLGLFKIAWIALICFYNVEGQGTPADQCTSQINSCACKTSKGYLNLEDLDQAKQNGQPKYANIIDGISGDTFWYNPCTDFTSDASCTNIAGCQDHYGLKYPIGDQASATFKVDSTNAQGIEYTKTHSDGITRKMFVALMCDKSQEGTLTASGETSVGSAEYQFTLTTKYACSDVAPAPGGGGGGGGGGLSGGSILLIIVFVLLTVYLIGGVLFMRFYKGATGVEMIPNYEFWTALPGLVKDGGLFAWGKITRKNTQRSTYDSI